MKLSECVRKGKGGFFWAGENSTLWQCPGIAPVAGNDCFSTNSRWPTTMIGPGGES